MLACCEKVYGLVVLRGRNGENKMKICILGRFPPPIGGVSVYCKRRFHLLNSKGIDVVFLDFGDRNLLKKILKLRDYTFEVNSLNIYVVLFLFLINKIRSSIFVDHNSSRHFTGFKKFVLLRLISGCVGVNVVNEALKDFYPVDFDVRLISPFIPPEISEADEIIDGYPDDLKEFMQYKSVILNSAWKLIPHGDTDLYGIKTSLDLMEHFPDVRLLLVIGCFDESYFEPEYLNKINRYREQGRLYLLEGQYELWPIFIHKPICLRLTPTDGDSLTIKEALHFNSPVIASDVIDRPAGCEIYEYGNIDSLIYKLSKML